MESTAKQKLDSTAYKANRCDSGLTHYLRMPTCQQAVLLGVTLLLFLTSTFIASQYQAEVQAATDRAGSTCSWYRIQRGDTLLGIARRNNTTLAALALANGVYNVNLIFSGHLMCIPHGNGSKTWAAATDRSGLHSSGAVSWYSYKALQSSSHAQVVALLRDAAVRYNLPAKLLLAIAWQESGWTQQIIARDGGIGVMQLMPYTAQALNVMTRTQYNPYRLADNIDLGAIYLHILWVNFHGNLPQVISAYNEGGWNVAHRGIFNWSYVHSVLAIMRRF